MFDPELREYYLIKKSSQGWEKGNQGWIFGGAVEQWEQII